METAAAEFRDGSDAPSAVRDHNATPADGFLFRSRVYHTTLAGLKFECSLAFVTRQANVQVPTLITDTRTGAFDVSSFQQLFGSSDNISSGSAPSKVAAVTRGIRVFLRAALTPKPTASNRFPPHSKIYNWGQPTTFHVRGPPKHTYQDVDVKFPALVPRQDAQGFRIQSLRSRVSSGQSTG